MSKHSTLGVVIVPGGPRYPGIIQFIGSEIKYSFACNTVAGISEFVRSTGPALTAAHESFVATSANAASEMIVIGFH